MANQRSELPPPPVWLQNGTCHHPSLETDPDYLHNNPIESQEIMKALLLLILSILIIGTNSWFIYWINSSPLRSVPCSSRYLVTSLSSSQLMTGALITLWGVYPSLTECWPYGRLVCQVQAVARGALRQHTAFSLILIAVEQHTRQMEGRLHGVLFSTPLTIIYISISWIFSILLYTLIVFQLQGCHISISSFFVCEPYYRSLRLLVLCCCIFYFPTTMVLLYSYGTIHQTEVHRIRNRKALLAALPGLVGASVTSKKLVSGFKENRPDLLRSLSAISLSFIITATPWSILQIITSVTMEQVRSANEPHYISSFFCSLRCSPTFKFISCFLASACLCPSCSTFSTLG